MKMKTPIKQNNITQPDWGLPTLEEILNESMSLGEKASEFMTEKMKLAGMDDVARGLFVENTVHTSQKKYIQLLRQRLVIEYKVQTISESMLLDLAISAYFRALQSSTLYNRYAMEPDGSSSYNQLRLNVLKELGKQIEQANRQFLSSLATLREMK